WAADEMQFVLDDQVGWAQRAKWQCLRWGECASSWVRVRILYIRRTKPVSLAAAIDLPEEHAHLAAPRHLGKLVYGCDEHGRQAPVDLLVDDDHRQPLVGCLAPAERAGASRVATVRECAPDLA